MRERKFPKRQKKGVEAIDEEIKKHFAGKGVSHIKRCLYTLNSNLDIKEIVNNLITSL